MRRIVLGVIMLLSISYMSGQVKNKKITIDKLRNKYIGMEFVIKGSYEYDITWECSDIETDRWKDNYSNNYYTDFIFYLTDGTKTISTKISQYESKALMDNTAFQSIFVQYGAPIELITLTTAMKWKSEYEYYNYLMRGDITEGMSTVEVMISIGRPDNTITTSHGSRQEVYNNYNGTTYIYYQDNIVTSWSTHR